MGKDTKEAPSRWKQMKKKAFPKSKKPGKKSDLDGLERMTCINGIKESDLDNYFQKIRDKFGASADQDLHVKAIQLVRGLPTNVLQHCELSVLGDFTAVYFLSGKGSKRLCVQPEAQKVKLQVHVENLILGFFRLPVGVASLLECVCAVYAVAMFFSGSDVEILEDCKSLANVCILLGDLVRAAVALLVAMDTVSAIPSLFSSPFHNNDAGNNFHAKSGTTTRATEPVGMGLWRPGKQRWLYRAVGYLVLSSRGNLTSSMAFVLSTPFVTQQTFTSGLDFSRVTLTLAALLSLVFHVITFIFPNAFKSPWASVKRSSPSPPLQSGDNDNKCGSDDSKKDDVTFEMTDVRSVTTRTLTWEISSHTVTHSEVDMEAGSMTTKSNEGGEQNSRCDNRFGCARFCPSFVSQRCCSLCGRIKYHLKDNPTDPPNEGGKQKSRRENCRGCARLCSSFISRHCSLILALRICTLVSIMATSLVVCVCHATRLNQPPARPSNLLTGLGDADWRMSCFSSTLLATVVMLSSGLLLVQKIFTHCCCQRVFAPVHTLLLALAACVSTLLSRDVVTWLGHQHWTEEQIGKVLFAGSLSVVSFPTVLALSAQLIQACSSQNRPRASTLVRSLRSSLSLKWIQQVLFTLSVLFGICGAVLAIWALPLPMAHVQTRFREKMNDCLDTLLDVQKRISEFTESLKGFEYAFACGQKDIKNVKKDLSTTKEKALGLTLAQLKDYCDSKNSTITFETDDQFCVKYTAAKLYFQGSMAFNATLHDRKILQHKTWGPLKKAEYLNDVIVRSRAHALEGVKVSDIKVDKSTAVKQACKHALIGICVAKHIAFVALLIPFYGVYATGAYFLVQTAEYVVRFLIDIASALPLVRQFQMLLNHIHATLLRFERDRTLQFSINNFNLIYLAYPAIISGCVVVLVGFWHRRGTYPSRQMRATQAVVVPLLLFNCVGLFVVHIWVHLVQLLAHSVPLMTITVTGLSALALLEAAYLLSVISCLLLILLAALQAFRFRLQQKAQRKAQEEAGQVTNIETDDEKHLCKKTKTSETVQVKETEIDVEGPLFKRNKTRETDTEKKEEASKGANRKITVTRETESRATVWLLAWLLCMGAVASVSVVYWQPVFQFKFELSANLQEVIAKTNQSSFGLELFEKVSSASYDVCNLGAFAGQVLLKKFVDQVKDTASPLTQFQNRFRDITVDLKADIPSPKLMHMQIPIMLTIYVPALAVTWAFVVTGLKRPQWGPSRRACRRLCGTMAWLTLGWITTGGWFLTSLGRSGVIPAYTIEVTTGSGLGYALGACVGMILATWELRLSGISPLL